MANIQNTLFDIFYMDTLASGKTWLHAVDPRAKVITTLIFIVTVVSFDKYEISMLMPFFFYPVIIAALAELPIGYLIKKMIILMPFAFFIGIFNPLIEREPLVIIDISSVIRLFQFIGLQIDSSVIEISGGWVSFLSIMIRFFLTVSAALILICITGFDAVCLALQKFGVPHIFTVQLMFLYRYMFVLIDEASRMVRARELRSFDTGNMRFKLFVPMVGQLILRTLDRAQRIHLAICCRGFNGEIQIMRKMEFGAVEISFTAGLTALFILFRLYNIPTYLGILITKQF